MGSRGLATVVVCVLAATAILAKTPKNVFSIRLPSTVRPETVQVRYFLGGKFGGYAGWNSYENEGSIWILTDYRESPAANLRAVIFSPSCEPERVVVEDLKKSSREYDFQCRPAPVISFRGKFPRPPEWQPLRVQVNVQYAAPWANDFFGIADAKLVPVDVADVAADPSGHFQVPLPVIGKDGKALDGAFSFVLREATSGNVLGILHPPQALRLPMGMKAAAEYPAAVEFALERNR